jgi:hypothetical protein
MTTSPAQYPLGALVICPDNRPGRVVATLVTDCNGRPMLGVRVDDGQKLNAVIFCYAEVLRASEAK